ncbi:hypothetical protein N9N67_00755 [Bacteriovoracaceae bacterium]|nr:hypothetical protein [Bacteriovoracaceae bacterium]
MKLINLLLTTILLSACWQENPKPYGNSKKSVKITKMFSNLNFENYKDEPETATIFFMPSKDELRGKNYQEEIKNRYANLIIFSQKFDDHYVAMNEERPVLEELKEKHECEFWDREEPEDRKNHSDECLALFDREYELGDRDAHLLGVMESQVNVGKRNNWFKPSGFGSVINLADLSKNKKTGIFLSELDYYGNSYSQDDKDIFNVKYYQLDEEKSVGMLEFILKEKGESEKYNDIIWEFKLEVSTFDKYLRLKGDVIKKKIIRDDNDIPVGHVELQQGSAKFDFPPKGSDEGDWDDDEDDWDDDDGDDWDDEETSDEDWDL